MLEDVKMVWQARSWMKKNEPFLPTWHAYVGYKLDLFAKLKDGRTIAELAQDWGYQEDLLHCWTDAGIELKHLSRSLDHIIVPSPDMLKYFAKESPYCIGELLREMLEMHIPALLAYPGLLEGRQKQTYYGDTYGQTVAATSALIEKRAFPMVYRWLKQKQAHTVLDIGCGHAGYLIRLAEKLGTGTFIGIDVNQQVIEAARQTIQDRNLPHVEVLEARIEEWSGPPAPVEMAMMNNILHYYSEQDRTSLLQRSADFLSPVGTLTIITPLYLERSGRRFATAFNSFMNAHENLYALPRKRELLQHARQAGLICRTVRPIVREGSWYFIGLEKMT